MRRAGLWVAVLAVLMIAAPSPAAAHATLISTSPSDGEVLEESPDDIVLTFTENVRLTDGVSLLTGAGDPVDVEVSASDATVSIVPVEPLDDGTYIVGWRVISADSHPVAGGFSFSVGAPSATTIGIPGSEAPRDVALLRKIAEGLRYGGLLLAAGLTAFAVLVTPRVTSTTARRRIRHTALGAAGLAVLGALLLVPLTTLWQTGGPMSAFGSAIVSGESWSSSTGGAAAATSAVVLAALGLWRLPATALMAAAVAVGSVALVGHTRTFGPAWLMLGSDLVHVGAAAVWLGGLAGLLILLARSSDVRSDQLQSGVRRFSAVALGSVAALVVSGGLLWWRVPQTITGLVDSSYGWHLLVKVALVLLVIGVASFNLRHLRSSRKVDGARVRRTVGVEAAILGAVLAVTGGLVTQSPVATQAEAAPATAELVREIELSGGGAATVTFIPGQVGTNAVQVSVVDPDGQPVEAVEPPTVEVGIEEFELGPFTHEINATAPGEYEGSVDLPIEGDWTVRLSIRISKFEQPSGTTTVEVE